MTRQYCHVGSRTIAYLDSAPGDASLRPYVLLHAFPLGANMWEPQMRSIPSGWRLITPAAIRGAIHRMMHRPDSTPLLAGIAVPTLVIAGEEDALTPVQEAQRLAEAIPGSTLVTIPAAGHLSNLEQPAAFNSALAAFFAGL